MLRLKKLFQSLNKDTQQNVGMDGWRHLGTAYCFYPSSTINLNVKIDQMVLHEWSLKAFLLLIYSGHVELAFYDGHY